VADEEPITRESLAFAAAFGAAAILAWTLIAPAVDIVVYAVFAYYIARPIYVRIEDRAKHPAPAAFASLFAVILPMMLVGLYVLGISYAELANFLGSNGSPYMDFGVSAAQGYASELSKLDLGEAAKALLADQNIMRAAQAAWSVGLAASWVIVKAVPSLILASYMLTDGPKLARWLVSCAPKGSEALVGEYGSEVDADLSKVFTGSIASAILIGLIAAVVFTAVNSAAAPAFRIPYPILCAVLCGLASLTPLVGASIFYAPLTAVFIVAAAAEGTLEAQLPYIAAFLATTFVVVDWAPNLLLKPKLTTRKIPSTLMLLAFILGPAAYGIPGLFQGPIVLVAVFHFCRIFLPRLRG
jgi:predicted PurR-regulated permease PerM